MRTITRHDDGSSTWWVKKERKMEEMEKAAGIDTSSSDYRLRQLLAEADDKLMENLVLARKLKGFSQLEIAARMKVDVSVVSEFERLGSDPNLSTIRRYAAAVEVSVTHHVKIAPQT